jgi:hypothetical protein
MFADRTLLAVTLATTFVAGAVTGWVTRDLRPEAPFRPRAAEHVYAPRLRALRDRGFDEAEMKEAVRVHQAYLDHYDRWWQSFLETHAPNLDVADRKFGEQMEALEERFRKRTGEPE